MSNQFKIGDTVFCTNITDSNFEDLELGCAYTVVGISPDLNDDIIYCVKDNDGEIYYAIQERFTEVPKIVDNVNHPSHYNQYSIEVIDLIEEATKNLKGIRAVCLGNAIKYILRYQFKNGIEDIQKAIFYLDKLIKDMEREYNES